MLILTIRTDKPEAEIGLFEDNKKLKYEIWTAHRQLAETLHSKIRYLLEDIGYDWNDIEGIICFKGPGSFTGLRIGLSVANALADSLSVPICSATGKDWIEQANTDLLAGKNVKLIVPNYGAEPHITKPASH